MATLTVVRDNASGVKFTALSNKRAYLFTEDGKLSFSFLIAPREGSLSNMSPDWVETERTLDAPLLQLKGYKLPEFKAKTVLADKYDPFVAVTADLRAFRAVATSDQRILFRYSTVEAGLWRCTDSSYEIMQRHPVSNEPTNVEIDFTLTRASDIGATNPGPLSGPGVAYAPGQVSGGRTHVLAAGETLYSVAQRYYGLGSLWPTIYDANRGKLDQPFGLRPGVRIVIP